ncbi:MAG: dihydrodipicolinate synthase family protein [Hyphomicrobiales bacterium]|nr:dihydrodipicolinate synthase family protein [Hyphomicrobiales bacterium]MCP4997254.1 dihydrodipicolinate synthase family protein [Hyphomicrobiales bacterium]
MSNLLNEQSDGVYIISATPFADDGSIDFESANSLVEFYVEHGVSGMTLLGMMGEAPKLTGEESSAFMRHMLKRIDGRVPVVVGVSNAGLKNLSDLVNESMDAGAAGVMIAPISGLVTEARIYAYFHQVFDALGADVPVCYQDYPQSTGIHISVECFNRMIDDFGSLVMLKHEDCPGLGKLSAVRTTALEGDRRRVSILVGNGGLYLPQEMARGADGAMTGFAYPEMLTQVVSLFKAGNTERAQDLYDAYLPLVRHEQQPGFGLAVRKELLRRRGAVASAATRAPGPGLGSTDHAELDLIVARVEKRLAELH